VNIIRRGTVDITSDARPRTNNTTGATAQKMPESWGKKKPPVADPKWDKAQIANSTNMQRMYRNAFVGTTMHNAYEGKTSYP